MNEKTVTNYLSGKESFFWTPDYVDTSAWIEHIPFAFWIIENLMPKMVVELGVHNGTSYFSFCQAVKRLNIDALCFGVDTWKGDEHSGFYEEEVFGKVMDHNGQKYSRFSTLIKSTFDEAKDYFIDGSIDLLHIDGMHTYESVRHDFETWLPKLTPNAIVLFHDINVRDRNFAVFRFWEELKQKYRHFQFDFGHGLGILAMGEVASEEISALLNTNKAGEYYIFLRNLFSDRGSAFKNKFDASMLLKHEREKFGMQAKTLSQVTENQVVLQSNYNQLLENYNQLGENNKELLANNDRLLESNKDLAEKNTQMQETCGELAESNKKLQETSQSADSDKIKYQASVTELSEKLTVANSSLNKMIKELSDQKSTIEELNTLIQKQDQVLRWYKDTYENRSIIGVLKEKFRSRLKKKLNPDIPKDMYISNNIAADDSAGGPATILTNSRNGKINNKRYQFKSGQGNVISTGQ